MDTDLINLLKITPGIIRTRRGITHQIIEPSDWTKMLTMHNPETTVKVGNWVQVRKGLYKGDVGLADRVESWGIEVLLVPRLKPPTTDPSLKRKRSAPRAVLALFDPIIFKAVHEIDPKCLGDESYTACGLKFEHGLLRKAYDFHSLSKISSISSYPLLLFRLSEHPLALRAAFPHPQEWIFEEGDRVVIRSSGEEGTVADVQQDYMEVFCGDEIGIKVVPWADIHKAINIGDYVKVTSGHLHGTAGWVVCVDRDVVNLVEKITMHPSEVKVCSIYIYLLIYSNLVDSGMRSISIG